MVVVKRGMSMEEPTVASSHRWTGHVRAAVVISSRRALAAELDLNRDKSRVCHN